jgi:hypothetical protein
VQGCQLIKLGESHTVAEDLLELEILVLLVLLLEEVLQALVEARVLQVCDTLRVFMMAGEIVINRAGMEEFLEVKIMLEPLRDPGQSLIGLVFISGHRVEACLYRGL